MQGEKGGMRKSLLLREDGFSADIFYIKKSLHEFHSCFYESLVFDSFVNC